MKNQLSLTLLACMPTIVLAETPNSGTILRDVTDHQTVTPTTITPLMAETGDISTDNTPISVSDVVLLGNTLLTTAQLEPKLSSVRGTTTTFGGLQSIAREITNTYHKAGYPLATVIIPPQRLENGVVRLQVIEGSIGNVIVNNKSRVLDKAIKGYLDESIKSGEPLRQADSEQALLLIKDLAGTDNVNYRLQGGQNGTDLVVELDKSRLMDGFVQVDNYGSKSTGEIRTRVGVNLNSPFGSGEKLSVQAMSSFKGVDYARVSADLPAGYDGLTVSAGVGHTTYELGGAFKDLNATGTANTVDIGTRYPINRSNRHNLWSSTNLEHRKLTDTVGATNTSTDKTITAFKVGLNGSHQDSLLAGGQTHWSIENTLGRLGIDTQDAKRLDSVSTKTAGLYQKVNANIARTQYLSPNLSLNLSLGGQWASKNLDSAEQFSLGGADGVAAYHSNEVSADTGMIGQTELRYAVLPNLTVSGFYDVGRAKLRAKPFLASDNFVTIQGGGLGLYANYKKMSLQSKIAVQDSKDDVHANKKVQAWAKVGFVF